jgi:hypothetical protein
LIGVILILAIVASSGGEAAPSNVEGCQMIEAALVNGGKILHSEECVRRYASDRDKIAVEFVTMRNGREVPLLQDGVSCGARFVIVRRISKAKKSDSETGALVVQLTKKTRKEFSFHAYLEVIDAGAVARGSIGCGAEWGGVLIRRKGKWRVAPETAWPTDETDERANPKRGAGDR